MSARLLTAREVAGMLGVSTETILRWTRKGEVPAVKLPSGQIRFREAEIEAWLAERATPSRGALTTPADAAQPRTLSSATLTTPEVEE